MQTFEKGDNSFVKSITIDSSLFPSFTYVDPITNEEYSVRYIFRATFPSRDDGFVTEKAIDVLPSKLNLSSLSSSVKQSPRGVSFRYIHTFKVDILLIILFNLFDVC
jgi:hypothetical protein